MRPMALPGCHRTSHETIELSIKFAREKEADLIAMAHHTREVDPEKALLGSTVEQVVLRSACPVASVNHPDRVADVLDDEA